MITQSELKQRLDYDQHTGLFTRKTSAGGWKAGEMDRGEYWNRVAYEAERTKLLIGERDTEPNILDYGDDITTPDQWAGEVRGGRPVWPNA